MEILNSLISLLIGIASTGAIGAIFWRKTFLRAKDAENRLAEANADSATWERYEKQLDHSQKTIGTLQEQIQLDAQRLSEQNKALDDKTDRIRELTDQLITSERNLNDANERIIKLTEERDYERYCKEQYKDWHCQKANCKDRVPPNPKIIGREWREPETQYKSIN